MNDIKYLTPVNGKKACKSVKKQSDALNDDDMIRCSPGSNLPVLLMSIDRQGR